MITNEMRDKLIAMARDASQNAYVPYSHFKVGAAILGEKGGIYTGCNVENASLGLTNTAKQIEVMVWARNLTKDNSLISTFPTVAQDGSYSGYPNAPRTYGVTVRKTF